MDRIADQILDLYRQVLRHLGRIGEVLVFGLPQPAEVVAEDETGPRRGRLVGAARMNERTAIDQDGPLLHLRLDHLVRFRFARAVPLVTADDELRAAIHRGEHVKRSERVDHALAGEARAGKHLVVAVKSLGGLAAFSRADIVEKKRRPFFLYMDEFQTFTTLSIARMISELRKYKAGLVLANQHHHQLENDIRYSVLGNAGTLVSFRTGPDDAIILGREFATRFEMLDIMNLANHHIYLKLMIDGVPTQPFSAKTLNPAKSQ